MNWRRRLREWRWALRNAGSRPPWLKMARSLLSGVVPRAVWRNRMRYGCYECPIFDHDRLICRGVFPPWDQHGCDCYVPYVALSAEPYEGGCYGRAKFGGDFGWGAYRFKTRWERLWSPVRFLLRR